MQKYNSEWSTRTDSCQAATRGHGGYVKLRQRCEHSATGVPFGIAGLPIARDEAVVEAGLDARVKPRATIGISYLGQLASTGQDHSVRGNFTWKF